MEMPAQEEEDFDDDTDYWGADFNPLRSVSGLQVAACPVISRGPFARGNIDLSAIREAFAHQAPQEVDLRRLQRLRALLANPARLAELEELDVDLWNINSALALEDLAPISGAVQLRQLKVRLQGYKMQDLRALSFLAQLQQLKRLRLHFSSCELLVDLADLSMALSQLLRLEDLKIDFGGCVQLRSVDTLGVVLATLTEVRHLAVILNDCAQLTSLRVLIAALPEMRKLRSLSLWLNRCVHLELDELSGLGKLQGLMDLSLMLDGCRQLCELAPLLALAKLTNLEYLHLDLSKCSLQPDLVTVMMALKRQAPFQTQALPLMRRLQSFQCSLPDLVAAFAPLAKLRKLALYLRDCAFDRAALRAALALFPCKLYLELEGRRLWKAEEL